MLNKKCDMFERFFCFHDSLLKNLSKRIQVRLENDSIHLDESKKSAYMLGVNSALLIIGFVLHVAEHSIKDRVEKLFFFTREGEFYIQVWKKLFPDNEFYGRPLPKVDVLEVSRQATFCASLQDVSVTEFMRIWNLYSIQSMYALFKTIGLDPGKYAYLCNRYGIVLCDEIVSPWQDKRIQKLFQDPDFVNIIKVKSNSDKSNILGYLMQHGCTHDLQRIGIVDIGWRGTIQDNIAYLLPKVKIFGYYMGLQTFLNQQPKNCIKSAFGPNANKSMDHLDLLDAVSVLEMLCNSPFGSVAGYIPNKDGLLISNRIISNDENVVFYEFVKYFQDGVLFSSILWSEYINAHVISSSELTEAAYAIWRTIVHSRNKSLSNAYCSLNHNEVFGLGRFVRKNTVPNIRDIVGAVFKKDLRPKIIMFLRQNQWVGSFSERSDLRFFHKLILIWMLKTALRYKHGRNYIKYKMKILRRAKNFSS